MPYWIVHRTLVPIHSPVYSYSNSTKESQHAGSGGASSDGEGSSGSGSRKPRTSLLQKLPPPQLKLSQPPVPTGSGGVEKLASSQSRQSTSQQFSPLTSPTNRSQTSNEEKERHPIEQSSNNPFLYSPHSRPSRSSTPSSFTMLPAHSSSFPIISPLSAPLPSLNNPSTLSFPSQPALPIPFASHDPYHLACLDTELDARMTDLVLFIAPSAASEHRYTATYHFVDSLIRRTIGAEVYAHGSFALKTYLPDADLDVSAFFSKTNEDSWIQRIVTALVALSQGEGHASTAVPAASAGGGGGGGGKDRERGGSRDRQREKLLEAERDSANQAAALSPSVGRYPVKSVTFISAETSVIKCQIGHISVDISGNATSSLSTLALFEQVDQLVGCSHLFKRTILLTTTYFKNELLISGSHAGLPLILLHPYIRTLHLQRISRRDTIASTRTVPSHVLLTALRLD